MKKLIALLLAVCCIVPLAACGGPSGDGGTGGKYNVAGTNKTVINFHNFNGGVGSAWLEEAAEEFAKQNAEKSFGGTSKKGVFIDIAKSMNVSVTGLANSTEHILTTDRFNSPNDVANAGELYNLNEVMADTSRVGGSLEDAIYDRIKPSLKGGDGNYYGLPHYEYYGGLSYSRTVFDTEKAFFADASDATAIPFKSRFSNQNYKMTGAEGKLTKGPDGVANTQDDGLPASLEEFLALMDYFKTRTAYAPIVVSGMHINYSNYFMDGLWAALAGQEQMNNYYNSKGDIEIVDGFTDEDLFKGISYLKKPIVKKVTLNDANGYLGQQMVAKYYAYALYEIMYKENLWSDDVANPGVNHYDAQLAFLIGQQAGNFSNAAMLCEATYWYNETKEGNNFNRTKLLAGKEESDFDVRFMSLPSTYYYSTTQQEKPSSIINIADSYLFVNKNIEKDADVEEAVVEFVKFLYSEEWLKKFTLSTGCMRAVEYNLTEEELATTNTFAANLWRIRKSDGSNTVYCTGDTEGYRLNRSTLKITLDGSMYRTDSTSHVYGGIKTHGAKALFEKTLLAEGAWKKA